MSPNSLSARRTESVYFQNISLGFEVGALLVSAFIRFVIEPSSVSDFIPAIGGAILGAFVASGIMEHQKQPQSSQQ